MPITRDVSFSVPIFPYARWHGVEAIAKGVRYVDSLGYWGVHFAEHLATPRVAGNDDLANFWYDNFGLAAYVSAGTRQIRFLFLVLVAPYRHPIGVARQLATLDLITGGRVIAGFGVGWLRSEFEALGVAFESRGHRTDEYLDALNELLTSPRATFSGEWVKFSDVIFEPKCVQQPGLPIWIGGNGKRALDRVARLGLGWAPTYPIDLDGVRDGVVALRSLMSDRGRDPDDIAVSVKLTVGSLDSAVVGAAKGHSDGKEMHSDVGRREADIRARIEVLRQIGVTHINLQFDWSTPDEWMEWTEWFKTEVVDTL